MKRCGADPSANCSGDSEPCCTDATVDACDAGLVCIGADPGMCEGVPSFSFSPVVSILASPLLFHTSFAALQSAEPRQGPAATATCVTPASSAASAPTPPCPACAKVRNRSLFLWLRARTTAVVSCALRCCAVCGAETQLCCVGNMCGVGLDCSEDGTCVPPGALPPLLLAGC